MRKRSIAIAGHRTSIALEIQFWDALARIASADGRSLPDIVADIDSERLKASPPPGLASALRVYVLERASADRRQS
ncbi:MAG: ribbon-helix-helix domain-containing protein [Parvularculaceae bacterium]